MKIKRLGAVPLAGAVLLVGMVMTKLQSRDLPGCLNLGGDISDHINTACAYCVQKSDGSWSTYSQNEGGTCGGTVYEEDVAQDIYCGYWPFPVYIWGQGVLEKNTRKATLTGTCVFGSCSGVKSTWSTTVYLMTVYDSNMCPTNTPGG